jgi:hypothetical protein
MTSHQLKDLVHDIIGFPAEPWKLVGVPRLVWFQNPLAALYTIHLLLAHTLNVVADKDDLPVAVAYPTKLGEFTLYRVPGRGNVFKNSVWRSFFIWLESVERAPERIERERHRHAVRRLIADKQTRPIAISPLPYDHALGPTGTGPKTFGHVGGGSRNNVLSTNVNKARVRMVALLGQLHKQGIHLVGNRPIYPLDPEQNRHFDASRKQYSRIKANGGKRRPVGRPRTIGSDKEKRALELLAAGWGIKRVAKEIGTGVSFVQRIKGTANRPGYY